VDLIIGQAVLGFCLDEIEEVFLEDVLVGVAC